MSFGGSEQTSQSKSQGNSFYDPTQTGIVNNFAQSVGKAAAPGGALAYTPYTGQGLNFGATQPQLDAQTNFKAPTVTGQGYTASTIDPSSVPNVTAGQLSSTDLSPYLNPYTSDVVNATTQQALRAKGITDTADAAKATAAGAFGGSRSAVLQNLDDASWGQNLQQTIAGLNQAGYTNAQGAAQQDIQSRLAAAQGNQQTGLAIGQTNVGAQNAASAAGAAAANAASQANQSGAIQGAQIVQSALGISDAQAQQIFGANWQQYLNSQTDPQAIQQLVTQAYSLVPSAALNQQTSSSFGQGVGVKFGGS